MPLEIYLQDLRGDEVTSTPQTIRLRSPLHKRSTSPLLSITTSLPSSSITIKRIVSLSKMPNSDKSYNVTSSGTNSQGNHYCHRDYSSSSTSASGGGSKSSNNNSYHYSNSNGSYYYSNPNSSTYYNDGNGGAKYTPPSGK
ncbi:MAG: hypothetical protein LQ347_002235 [Umbilicaria vellea]|nr:MAG: hypothetical protein LQ347_002235 [Umbilicaria vellea]